MADASTTTFSFTATRLDDGRVLLVDVGLDDVAVLSVRAQLPADDVAEAVRLEALDAAGELRSIEVSSAALQDEDGERHPDRYLVVRDLTEEVRHQRDAVAATAGVLAHDLRNPLAGIQAWLEPVSEGLEQGDLHLVRTFLDRVTRTVSRMQGLLDRILLYATDADAELVTTRVELSRLVEDVCATLGVRDVVRHGALPGVDADPVLLRQVLDNLITNSLKYVAPGDRPRIEISGVTLDDGTVVVSVADEGIGIPVDEREAVFDIYRRTHHGFEGSGLGLAICRRIISRHGGMIVADANPAGPGTVITFTLPPH